MTEMAKWFGFGCFEPQPKRRKAWRKPKISDYGHVSKLTAGTTGSHADKGFVANQHGAG